MTTPYRRCALLLLVAGLSVAPQALARGKAMNLKFPRIEVPPRSDSERCIFVRLPRDTPIETGGTLIVNKGIKKGFVSHHFLMWAYQGTQAAGFPTDVKPVPGEACLDFGPSDRDQRVLIAGSQSVSFRQVIPSGVAQRIEPVDENGKKVVGLILNTHWINSTDKTHTASVKIKLYPARGKKIKRYVQPIFEVVANGALKVAPSSERTTGADWPTPKFIQQIGVPLAGGRNPEGSACVVMLTAHMHKRGKLFTIDFYDGTNPTPENMFSASDYSDPGSRLFNGRGRNAPPFLVKPGQRLHYTCTHDNGMEKEMKLGCEEAFAEAGQACTSNANCGKLGTCVDGVCKSVPGRSIVQSLFDPSAGRIDGAAKRCAVDADCPATDAAYPDRTFTGRCVPSNLVFGFTSEDDMCIMPGAYFDANPDAPPGKECDLSLM